MGGSMRLCLLGYVPPSILLLLLGLGWQSMTAQAPSREEREVLSEEQMAAVAVVEGNAGNGTAFLCRIQGEVMLVTNQHLLSGQQRVRIRLRDGREVVPGALHAAEDADIVMARLPKAPSGIEPLEILVAPEAFTATQDEVVIPGNSKGDGVITVTPGKLVAFGPRRVEIDNPVYAGNSGSPIIHRKTGKVIGVLTEAELIALDDLDLTSFRSANSSIKSEIRYFGHRIDTVQNWPELNWATFHKNDQAIARSRLELEAIYAYFTGSSSSYKDFRALHRLRNETIEELSRPRMSAVDRGKTVDHFFDEIDGMIDSAVNRIDRPHLEFIHRTEAEQLRRLARALRAGTAIARRDDATTRLLIERGR